VKWKRDRGWFDQDSVPVGLFQGQAELAALADKGMEFPIARGLRFTHMQV